MYAFPHAKVTNYVDDEKTNYVLVEETAEVVHAQIPRELVHSITLFFREINKNLESKLFKIQNKQIIILQKIFFGRRNQ